MWRVYRDELHGTLVAHTRPGEELGPPTRHLKPCVCDRSRRRWRRLPIGWIPRSTPSPLRRRRTTPRAPTALLPAHRTPGRRTRDHPLLNDTPTRMTGNLTGIPFCPDASIEAQRTVTGAARGSEPLVPRRERNRTHLRRSRRRHGARADTRQGLPRRPVPRRAAVDRLDHLGEGRPVRPRHCGHSLRA